MKTKKIEDFFNDVPSLKSLSNSIKSAFDNLYVDLVEQSRTEDDENVYIHLAIAGMTKEDITIEVDEFLTVKGKVNTESKYICFHKNFVKHFQLDKKIDKTDISADMTDGILTITLPKILEKKPSAIKIDIK